MELIITGLISGLVAFLATYLTQKATNKANIEDAKQLSYESKTGENAATKNDIEEITSKIETIKTQLAELSSKKYDRFMQFRIAIVEFLDALTIMIEWKFKMIPMGEDVHNHSAIKDGYSNFISAWAELASKIRKVQLYSDKSDAEFNKQLFIHYKVLSEQYAVTVEYFDALIRNTGFGKDRDSRYVIQVSQGVDSFITKRNKIEGKVFESYYTIQQLLQSKLSDKYTS